ncbi:MAG: GTPase ObgE [Chloroflexota bacterium]
MFYDRAKIWVKAGNGGNGSASFRREKFVPKGGPDGGDGGRGSSVYLRVNPDLNTLLPFHYRQHYKGEHGGNGGSNQKHGKAASDIYIDVPPGTFVEILDENPISGAATEVVQADLVRPGETMMVARGGRGGLGNIHFATSTHQTPRYAEKGEPGTERMVIMELKVIADVGIIGYPNVGKSTLLAVVSAAEPKIADYPFTTLQPMLGVVSVGDYSFVMADIPGLIEGASSGAGLGLEFLRHVERTRLLVHMVDGSAGLWWDANAEAEAGNAHPSQTIDPVADFKRINTELEQYDAELASKPQIIAINKVDLQEVRDRMPSLIKQFNAMGYTDIFPVSAATGEGIQELMGFVAARLREMPKPAWQEEPPPEEVVVKPRHVASEAERFEIVRESKRHFRVLGERIERMVSMTDMSNPFAVDRLQKELEKLKVSPSLREAGVETGDTVSIGRMDLIWSNEPWMDFEKNTSRRKQKEGPGKQHS